MQLPQLTPQEQGALIEAMKSSFGACTCREVNGRTMLCDGHKFLSESEAFGVSREQIDRVSRLAVYRRASRLWIQAEHGQPFRLEPPLPPDLLSFSLTPVPGSPPQGDDSNTLPW